MPMTKDDVQRPRHPDLEKIIVRGDKACAGHFFDHTMQKLKNLAASYGECARCCGSNSTLLYSPRNEIDDLLRPLETSSSTCFIYII